MQFRPISGRMLSGVLMTLAAFPLAAVPEAKIHQNEIILSNAGAEYHFTAKAPCSLTACFFHGKNTGMTKFGYSLMDSDLQWTNDADLGKWSYKILKDKESVMLRTSVNGPGMRLLREYTLRSSSASMEMRFRAEYDHPENVRWAFLFGSRLPVDKPFLRLVSEVHSGKISTELRMIPNTHFLDGKGNLRKVQNSIYAKWEDLFLIGSYNPDNKSGFLVMTDLERTPWPMQVRQENKNKIGFHVAPYVFSIDGNGKHFQEICLTLLPFQEDPASLNANVIAAFVSRMNAKRLLHAKAQTGRLLPGPGIPVVWTDFADARVYPSERPPEKKTGAVEIYAARGERESFQLALRSPKALGNVALRTESLRSADDPKAAIPLQWNPV